MKNRVRENVEGTGNGDGAGQQGTTRERLVLQYMPQVQRVAHTIRAKLPPSIDVQDLVSAGVCGLLYAMEKYEPSRGTNFASYAEFRIRGAILDSLRRDDWAPRSLRRKQKRLMKAARDAAARLGREPAGEEIAREMGMPLKEYHALANQVKMLEGQVMPDPKSLDSDPKPARLDRDIHISRGRDPFTLLHEEERQRILAGALDRLPGRQRLIVALYHFDGRKLSEISRIVGLNQSRVSQIRSEAIERLRRSLNCLEMN